MSRLPNPPRPSLTLHAPASLVATAALLLASPARAQMATDRPDFVESSSVVGAEALQLESGLAYADDTGHVWTTPTLLRLGVGERTELRLESELVTHESPGSGGGHTGLADVSLGVKWHWTDARDSRPSTALLVHADLPTGSERFRGEGVRPSLRLSAEWDLTTRVSLGVMPGVYRLDGGGAAGLLGLVLGVGWTDRFGAFAELALPRIAGDEHGGTEGTWDAGLTWLLRPDLQLDAAFSVPATGEPPDFSFGVGISALLDLARDG